MIPLLSTMENETSKNKKILKKIAIIFIIIILVIFFLAIAGYASIKHVDSTGNQYLIYYDYAKSVDHHDFGIVPGTTTVNNFPAPMLQKRLDKAYQLYTDNKISQIIISDGSKKTLGVMFEYLKAKGIPEDDIYLDNEGEDTYKTIQNSLESFPDSTFYIFTQEQFANRAGYILNSFEPSSKVVIADEIIYQVYLKEELREYGAKIKAFINVSLPVTAGSGSDQLIGGADYEE